MTTFSFQSGLIIYVSTITADVLRLISRTVKEVFYNLWLLPPLKLQSYGSI